MSTKVSAAGADTREDADLQGPEPLPRWARDPHVRVRASIGAGGNMPTEAMSPSVQISV